MLFLCFLSELHHQRLRVSTLLGSVVWIFQKTPALGHEADGNLQGGVSIKGHNGPVEGFGGVLCWFES